MQLNIGALIIRIVFGGPLYYNCNKEPPKPYSNYLGPYIKAVSGSRDPSGLGDWRHKPSAETNWSAGFGALSESRRHSGTAVRCAILDLPFRPSEAVVEDYRCILAGIWSPRVFVGLGSAVHGHRAVGSVDERCRGLVRGGLHLDLISKGQEFLLVATELDGSISLINRRL